MSQDAQTIPAETPDLDLRLTIDAELGELYEHLRGKSRKAREAVHLMRLGLMYLNGGVVAAPAVVPAASPATGRTKQPRAAPAAAATPAPKGGGGTQELSGLAGLDSLTGFGQSFFAPTK